MIEVDAIRQLPAMSPRAAIRRIRNFHFTQWGRPR